MNFKEVIRVIEGFPKPGISFKDITTLLKDGNYYKEAIDTIVKEVKPWNPELVVGPEARGFLFGAPVAYSLGVGFVPVRKPGKLPAATVRETYTLEYGVDTLEVHADAIKPGQRVVIVDDLLATGGTMLATAKLVEKAGGVVVGMAFLIELEALGGRKKLADYKVVSIVNYND